MTTTEQVKKQNKLEDSKIPDILDSKTARVLLELPGYDKTKFFFLGRKELLARSKNLVISTPSKTGVYLVAGVRGVGKSSLIDKVINIRLVRQPH